MPAGDFSVDQNGSSAIGDARSDSSLLALAFVEFREAVREFPERYQRIFEENLDLDQIELQ
jgi:hypothetical protein